MNLYQLNDAITNFQFEFDEVTGEILNLNELYDLEAMTKERKEQVALWIKNLRYEAEAITNEIKTLAERKKRLERKIEGISEYLQVNMNGEKLETPKVAITFRKSETVDCHEGIEEYLVMHDKFGLYTLKTECKVNKAEVKKALKNGDDLGGYAHLVPNQNMIIK